LVLNEWEQPADGGYASWNTIYSLINQNIKEWAKTTNVTYVDIFKLGGDFAGLTANNYYSSGGLTQHLNSEGYRVLTNNIMTALLKQRNTNRYS
jgi:lysophospholipase L1-like esterase